MTPPATLRRTLGFTDLMLITIGTVIGSGIYLVPSVVLRQSGGRASVAIIVWTAGGVLSLLGALTYAELGAANPDAGGLYVYLRDAFGPLVAFLYGWTSFVVIASGSVATLAVAFSSYLGQLVPVNAAAARAISVALIILLAVVNMRGARNSATLQNWTTGAKVAVLTSLSLALIVLGRGHAAPAAAPSAPLDASLSFAGIGAAMIAVLWAYEGWQYVTFSAGETNDPQRVFPRAITAATAALVAIYLLANFGYLSALGTPAAASSQHVAADAVGTLFGDAAGKIVGALILVSIFSATNGLFLTTPRMYFAMARDGVFFARLANIDPRFGTPVFAIVSLAVWSAVLAVSGTFEQLLTYVVFAGWIFYGLGALAIFVYRQRSPNAVRPFRTPGYPLSPILFVASAALLVLNTLATQPMRAAIGLSAVVLGTPAFYLWRARTKRAMQSLAPTT
jgi:APA family basic amino acid/polyamine antiporter